MAGFAGLTNVQRKQQPCILPFATGTAADGVLKEKQARNIRWSQARDAEAGRSTMKAFHIRFGSMLVEEVASFAAGEPVWFHSTVKRSPHLFSDLNSREMILIAKVSRVQR